MGKITLLLTALFGLFLLGNALAVSEYALDVKSPPGVPVIENTNPSSVVPQFAYDLGLTNIGIEAQPDLCMQYGETWEFWVKAYNNGYEVVNGAEIVFTIDGEEIGRRAVSGLQPGVTEKYLASFYVDLWPFTIDAHVDWALDENPDNNDIEDEYEVADEPSRVLRRDSGVISNAWTWLEGYEYPDYAQASKWVLEFSGLITYWQIAYTNVCGYPGGHAELFVFAADDDGNIIDDGTGGIMNMEFQFPEVYWTNSHWLCYNICLPVEPGDTYYFAWTNRQSLRNYWVIDDGEDNPDWNWYKDSGTWYQGNLYDGDWWLQVGMLSWDWFRCDALTPVFCRGKTFCFSTTMPNYTGGPISGIMTFTGYAGYDCDPNNALTAIPKYKTYPEGRTTDYYYFQVPNAVGPGQYSASVHGTLAGYDLFCCMNVDIIQCSPWRSGNTEWELVEVDRPDVDLPTLTSLAQNHPNPFNAETGIGYVLAEAGNVNLSIYDLSGRLIETLVDEHQEAGEHVVNWNGGSVSSGVYFYKITTFDYTCTKKMNLLR